MSDSYYDKLDRADEIRSLYATGNYSYEQLGVIFKLSRNAIGDIVRGDTFEDPDYEAPSPYWRTPRLSWEEAVEIRKNYNGQRGEIGRIAEYYGISEAQVSNILRNHSFHDPDYIVPAKPEGRFGLSDADIYEVRYLASLGVKPADICRDYGLKPMQVRRLVADLR